MENKTIVIGGMQEHQSIKTDGVCTCLTSSMGTGGGYVPMISEIRKVDSMYGKNRIVEQSRAEQSRAEQSRAEQSSLMVA